MLRMKPNKSAAARTVPLLGVDLREQRVEDPLPPGPVLKRKVFRVDGQLSAHLTFGVVPVCHANGEMRELEPIMTEVCQACLVEASRQRATVK
jgi:hypothetical protein